MQYASICVWFSPQDIKCHENVKPRLNSCLKNAYRSRVENQTICICDVVPIGVCPKWNAVNRKKYLNHYKDWKKRVKVEKGLFLIMS